MKKALREAIGDYVSPQEMQRVKSTLSPATAAGFLRALSQLRRRNKGLDLSQAAIQYSQFLTSRGAEADPGLMNLTRRSKPAVEKKALPPAKRRREGRMFDPSVVKKPKTNRGTLFQKQATMPKRSDVSAHTEPLAPRQARVADIAPEQEEARAAITPGTKEFEKYKDDYRKLRKMKGTQFYEGPLSDAERLGVMQKESKMSKKVKTILLEEVKRAKARKILGAKLVEQAQVQQLAADLLTEGPMSNVWGKIKDAGSSFMGGLKGAAGQAQKAGNSQVEEQRKQVMQAIEKALKQAEGERRKFNSEILKTAQLMQSYHDAVMEVFALYSKYQSRLGPAGMQVNRQINDALEALEDDLMSEVSQIEAMFKQVKKKDISLDKMLKQHKTRMGEKRENEADASARMASSYGVTDEKMPSKMRLPKVDVPFRSKEEDTGTGSAQRVKYMDKKANHAHAAEMKEIQDAYKQTSKDLFRRLMKTQDPEEKKSITRQMYDIAKSKIEREKELKKKLSGYGIRKK